jgi:hypothetical protein
MNKKEFVNILDLLIDIKINGSAIILNLDCAHELRYGWQDDINHIYWSITLSNLRKSLEEIKNIDFQLYECIKEHFFTRSSSTEMVHQLINKLPSLERYNKLKAFW